MRLPRPTNIENEKPWFRIVENIHRRSFRFAFIDRHFKAIRGLFPGFVEANPPKHDDRASVMKRCHFGVTGLSSLFCPEWVRVLPEIICGRSLPIPRVHRQKREHWRLRHRLFRHVWRRRGDRPRLAEVRER